MNVLQLKVAAPYVTIELLWAGAGAGVRRAPHEVSAAAAPGHVLWGAWRQQSSGKHSQGIAPWAGRSIDGAAIYPSCRVIHLKWIICKLKTQQVHSKSHTVYCVYIRTCVRGLLGLLPVLGSHSALWNWSRTGCEELEPKTGSSFWTLICMNSGGQPGLRDSEISDHTW